MFSYFKVNKATKCSTLALNKFKRKTAVLNTRKIGHSFNRTSIQIPPSIPIAWFHSFATFAKCKDLYTYIQETHSRHIRNN